MIARRLAEGGTSVDHSLQLVGRLMAALYLLGGAVGLLSPVLPPASASMLGVLVTGSAAVAVGFVAWFLPW